MPADTVATIADGERLTLIDVGGGRRITLDPFGTRVWKLLADHPTLPRLLDGLWEEQERAERNAEDVARLLAHWSRRGLVTWR